MLEEPAINKIQLIECLQEDFELSITDVTFLPIGADLDSAVYRAAGAEGVIYFVKLRSGDFNPATVLVPNFLSEQGVREIIPTLITNTGRLWAERSGFKVLVNPYIEGADGYQADLSPSEWTALGRAVRQIHDLPLPDQLASHIRREDFDDVWRKKLQAHIKSLESSVFPDPIAEELVKFLNANEAAINTLLQRVNHLAGEIQLSAHEFVLCHGDLHGWNLLVDRERMLYLLDWDTVLLAPRERDLMFIGSGIGTSKNPPEEEIEMFLQGYGKIEIDQRLIARYRYERIIEDMAIYCDQLLLSNQGGKDRAQALFHLKTNFLPGGTIEAAQRADHWIR